MPKCPKDCKEKNCIFFRTVKVPAIVANDEETPPKNGEYCNALVVYEATGDAYLFPSDGIPTLLSATDYALLKNLPSINGVTIVGDLTLSDIGVTQLVQEETDARIASDNNLQEQIDAIVASSDVVDIVGTYEELEEYDTSHLTANDVIKVISDETEGGATTYYRWTGSSWSYIGAEGPYYTAAEIDSMLDDKLDVDALEDYYDKSEVNALLADKANTSDLASKQNTLVAGTNITIDAATNVISATDTNTTYTAGTGLSLTGTEFSVDSSVVALQTDIPTSVSQLNNDSGYLTSIPTASSSTLGGIKVGTGLSIDSSGVLSATVPSITVDSALSTTSTNPVENRVITNALSNKADVSAIPVVPTNVSAFYNDAGYVTSSIIASNYYNKTETYTQNEVDGLISGVSASIPTKTSDLVNDGADNTSTYVEADELAAVATSGSYNDLSDKPTIMTGLVEMSYGESNAWAKFIAAYQAQQIVYCRASSNSNPASGSQTRKAFMAYVNNAETPTEVEFQYVRSVSSKTSSQPVDQVFVYKLTSSNGGTWTVQTRDMAPKLAQGTNTTVSYSNGTYTISATQPTVNDATLTIQKNGTTVETFTANSSTNKTANISVPTATSDLNNDSGFLTATDYASANTGGVVKVGSNLSIDANGVLSAAGAAYSAGTNITIANDTISTTAAKVTFREWS